MNVTETIFALALASNFNPKQHFHTAFAQLKQLGDIRFSKIYEIPCRDGIGADYWNAACLLKTKLGYSAMIDLLKQMETRSGRVRPSHQISLDVDLIAWGHHLSEMQFNPKKLPLALDVKIPMGDIWPDPVFQHEIYNFPVIKNL